MGFRNLVITSHAKLTYSQGLVVIQNIDGVKQIPLIDLDLIIIDSTQVMVSSYLIAECASKGIKIIFSDKTRNPIGELVGYYINKKTVNNIEKQLNWSKERKERLWTKIVYEKIFNQIKALEICNKNSNSIIDELDKLELGDVTNREAVVAQKYFPLLYGEDFVRSKGSELNKALNYGYSLLLSTVNKEVTSLGYLTQFGIHHKNKENYFNLSCDLMEIFRPLIDVWIYSRNFEQFTSEVKFGLIDLLNVEIRYANKNILLRNAISKCVVDCLNYLNGNIDEIDLELVITDEVQSNAINSDV